MWLSWCVGSGQAGLQVVNTNQHKMQFKDFLNLAQFCYVAFRGRDSESEQELCIKVFLSFQTSNSQRSAACILGRHVIVQCGISVPRGLPNLWLCAQETALQEPNSLTNKPQMCLCGLWPNYCEVHIDLDHSPLLEITFSSSPSCLILIFKCQHCYYQRGLNV